MTGNTSNQGKSVCKDTLRVAIYQCGSNDGVPYSKPDNLEHLKEALTQAAAKSPSASADLVVFPELFLCGYNLSKNEMLKNAEDGTNGPSVTYVKQLCKKLGVACCYGFAAISNDSSTNDGRIKCYCASNLIDGCGELLQTYYKTHLWGPEEKDKFDCGDTLNTPVALKIPRSRMKETTTTTVNITSINTNNTNHNGITKSKSIGSHNDSDIDNTTLVWKVSQLICYDMEFPENARQLALAGADIILCPTANPEPSYFVNDTIIPCRAAENHVYIVYSNHAGGRSGIENGLEFCGKSVIAGCFPFGKSDKRIPVSYSINQTLKKDFVGLSPVFELEKLDRKLLDLNNGDYIRDRRPEIYTLH
jgi:predicted amidohydrolase